MPSFPTWIPPWMVLTAAGCLLFVLGLLTGGWLAERSVSSQIALLRHQLSESDACVRSLYALGERRAAWLVSQIGRTRE